MRRKDVKISEMYQLSMKIFRGETTYQVNSAFLILKEDDTLGFYALFENGQVWPIYEHIFRELT